MKLNFLRLVLLTGLLFVLTDVQAQSKDKLPAGRWGVEKISMDKTIDGKRQAGEYKTVAELKSHIPCPKEWEVTEKNIVLHYGDNMKETIENTLSGGKLTLDAYDGTIQQYQFTISENEIVIAISYNYNINASARGGVLQVSEKRTISLKKIKTDETKNN